MEDVIRKHALLNASLYGGKANEKAVLGKVLAENPELRKDVLGLMKKISKIIKEVNSMKPDEQDKIVKELGMKKIEKKEREGLPPLPNAIKGKVVTRIPPEPSKYNHIGHALSFLTNYLYAKMYKGKCILRFEDTNPEKVKKEYVDAMKEDVLEYLDIKPNKTIFTSSDLPKMYKYAEKLIEDGEAYVCTCTRENMQKMRHSGTECEHRIQSVDENLLKWKEMFAKKYKEGEAILRLKIDMTALNHVMRDPVIFRISYASHFIHKNKYCVWPLYDFQAAVEEELCGITHILRSAEFGAMRIELQDHIRELLDFRKQTTIQYGRFEVEGAVTQGREIREMIEQGKVTGWDDPRLVTLKALRKRGIVKETYYKLAEKIGLNPASIKIQWKMIAAENRKIIDPTSERYFFVSDPVEITLSKVLSKNVKAPLLPKKKKFRKIPVTKKIYVDKIDFVANRGKEVRLMHFCNVKLEHKARVTGKANKDIQKIHWVSGKNAIKNIELVMPNGKVVVGIGESAMIKNLKIGDIIQLTRIGFARVDKIDKKRKYLRLCFAHE